MREVCISVKTLYEHFGEKLAHGTIESSLYTDNGIDADFYDLYNTNDALACCDGEAVQVIEENENSVKLLNPTTRGGIEFMLSKEEFKMAKYDRRR